MPLAKITGLICCLSLCLPAYNFSHRIDHLSFGELIPGIINPLDGTEKIASDRKWVSIFFFLGGGIRFICCSAWITIFFLISLDGIYCGVSVAFFLTTLVRC